MDMLTKNIEKRQRGDIYRANTITKYSHRHPRHTRKKTVCVWTIILFILLLSRNDCLSYSSPDLNYADSIAFPAVDSSIVTRQQLVELNLEQFTNCTHRAIRLGLFDDVALVALFEKQSSTPDGSLVWQGKILDQPGSRVLFVLNGGRISGEIALSETLYHVRSIDEGIHIVQEITPTVHSRLQDLAVARGVSDDVVTLTNEERAKYGLYALVYDSQLTQAAQGHAEDMALNDYFDHTGLDGRSPADRITDAGYIWNYCAENIAAGYPDAASAVDGWINSPGHHANMLSTTACDLGVGYAYDGTAYYGHYWVQNFGRKSGVTACPGVDGKAPDVVTGTATQVGADSVRLTGTVNPNGLSTTYYFQVGFTTAYGSTSPMLSAGSGSVPLFVESTPSGFVPSNVYHYRLVAYNSEGTTYGQDEIFTTSGQRPDQKLPISILHLLLGKK